MKIISWNVNSIRKGIDEELTTLVKNQDPDIICFQETKCIEEDGEKYFVDKEILKTYPYRFWNSSVKGQAGVSIWCKESPSNVIDFIPGLGKIQEGRILFLEFENLKILNTYVPNTGRGEIAENNRYMWHKCLIDWFEEQQLHGEKIFIWCGDLNVVDEPKLDTSHHVKRQLGSNNIAGLKEFEKNHFDEYKKIGFVDVFRTLYPTKKSFTWFSPITTTVGWRLDYFLVDNISKVKDIIHNTKLPSKVSDHTWIMLIVEF